MIKPVQILEDLINGLLHEVEITSIVDNGNSTWTLSTCFTFYLTISKQVTIGGLVYKIVDFTLNQSLIVQGVNHTTAPTATSFTIASPKFRHGTPKMVNAEHTKEKTENGKYPFIWLVEINTIDNDAAFSAVVTKTMATELMFLTDNDKPNWLINDHYINSIYPMLNEAEFIMKAIKARVDLFGEEVDYSTTNHPNFGEYLTNKGYTEQIISDNVSGVQLSMDLPFVAEICDDCQTVVVCKPATETFNGAAISSIPSGGNKNIIVQNDATIPVQVGTIFTDTPESLLISVPEAASAALNTANVYKTGQNVSHLTDDDGAEKRGRGFDFFTLNFNNGFGNTNRFTDTLGTQIYTDDIVIDWSSWNQVTSTINGFYRIKQGGATSMSFNIINQPYTASIYSDWKIPNNNEFLSIYNTSITRDYLNYSPFNLPVGVSNTRMQTSSTETPSIGFLFNGVAHLIVNNITANMSYILKRTFTFAELGL